MKKVLLVSTIVLALIGCKEEKKEEIKDVQYYRTHKAERLEKLKICRNSAEKELSINCQNAAKADRQAEASKTGSIKL